MPETREEFSKRIKTLEKVVKVHVTSSDSLMNESVDCLIQIGPLSTAGGYACAYLDDGQIDQLIDALTRYKALPK